MDDVSHHDVLESYNTTGLWPTYIPRQGRQTERLHRCLDDSQVNDKSKRSMLPEWLDGRTVALLAAFIALGALIQTSFSDMRQDLSTFRAEMGTFRAEMGTFRAEMGTFRAEMGTMRDQMGTMRDQMGTMQGEMGTMRDQIGKVQGEIGAMRGEMYRLGKELTARIDGVREQLRGEIHGLRVELRADIAKLDDRLRAVEIDVAAIRTLVVGFDDQGRTVGQHARDRTDAPVADRPGG